MAPARVASPVWNSQVLTKPVGSMLLMAWTLDGGTQQIDGERVRRRRGGWMRIVRDQQAQCCWLAVASGVFSWWSLGLCSRSPVAKPSTAAATDVPDSSPVGALPELGCRALFLVAEDLGIHDPRLVTDGGVKVGVSGRVRGSPVLPAGCFARGSPAPLSGIRPSFFTSRWTRSPGLACS